MIDIIHHLIVFVILYLNRISFTVCNVKGPLHNDRLHLMLKVAKLFES
jgi:hypothetical protein